MFDDDHADARNFHLRNAMDQEKLGELLSTKGKLYLKEPPKGKIVELTLIPTDWALCDGRTLIRSEYVELFETMGVTFGGFGSPDKFSIPNYVQSSHPDYDYVIAPFIRLRTNEGVPAGSLIHLVLRSERVELV